MLYLYSTNFNFRTILLKVRNLIEMLKGGKEKIIQSSESAEENTIEEEDHCLSPSFIKCCQKE